MIQWSQQRSGWCMVLYEGIKRLHQTDATAPERVMRTRKTISLYVAVLAIFALFKPVTVNAQVTANDYKSWSDDLQYGYITGFAEGLLLFGHKTPFFGCGSEMTYAQIQAIIEKYLEQNPTLWHEPLMKSSAVAIAGACKDLQ